MLRLSLTVILALAGVSMSQLAYSVPLTWTVNDAMFDDGTSLTGQFSYDADTNTIGAFSLTTQDGIQRGGFGFVGPDSTPFAGHTYSNTNFEFLDFSATSSGLLTISSTGNRYLLLAFAGATSLRDVLTNAGGTVAFSNTVPFVLGRSSWECNNCDMGRLLVSGSVSAPRTTNVPEPATLGLLGFGLIGTALRRRAKMLR